METWLDEWYCITLFTEYCWSDLEQYRVMGGGVSKSLSALTRPSHSPDLSAFGVKRAKQPLKRKLLQDAPPEEFGPPGEGCPGGRTTTPSAMAVRECEYPA